MARFRICPEIGLFKGKTGIKVYCCYCSVLIFSDYQWVYLAVEEYNASYSSCLAMSNLHVRSCNPTSKKYLSRFVLLYHDIPKKK